MASDVEPIALSELIAKVKSDLLAGADPAGEQAPLLYVDAVEITAQVVAKREESGGAKAGLSLSILGYGVKAGLDAKTAVSHDLTQTVTVKLSPVLSKADYLGALTPEERLRLAATQRQGAVRGAGDQGGALA